MSDKTRPWSERIARLAGSTAFKDIREGFGGAAPIFTDTEVSMALALARKRMTDAECDLGDVGPEVLETYYGSTQQHRRVLVRAYLAALGEDARAGMKACAYRMGATLAAQQIAGVEITRTQQAEYAFIANTRLETLRDAIAAAFRWYMERHDAALPRFITILHKLAQGRLVEFLAERAKREEASRARIADRVAAQKAERDQAA